MVEEDWLFGQYLLRFSKYRSRLSSSIIEEAIKKQSQEDDKNSKHRKLGEILMNDYDIFYYDKELDEALGDFEKFRDTYMR